MGAVREPDPLLRRLARDGVMFCVGASAILFAVRGGRLDIPLGILGGGGLVGVSYWAIRSSIDAVARAAAGTPTGGMSLAWPLVKFGGRYALLAFLAYVMIARLRLHPIGLLIGASSLVAAATAEAARVVVSPRVRHRRRDSQED